MAEDGAVTLPVIGSVKQRYVWAMGAAAAGIVVYAYWRQSQQEAAAAAAEAVPVEAVGTIGADIGSGPGGYFGTPPIGGDTTIGAPIATNAAWFQAAVDYLEARGINSSAASKALGDFLDHRPLNATDQGYVRIALGAVGNPPQGGPWNIITDTSISAPSGLRVSGIFENSFTLSWNAQNNAKSYRIFEDGKVLKDTANTHLNVTGRKAGTKYGPFQVAAISAAGTEGARSMPVSVTTRGTPAVFGTKPVGKVANLHLMDATYTTVDIGWNAIDGAEFYDVYRGGKKIFRHRGTYHTDRGLKKNTKYSYYVIAVDSEGKAGPRSSTLTVRTKK